MTEPVFPPDVKPSGGGEVAVSTSIHWYDPILHPPPRGVQMRLLTFAGFDTRGVWSDNGLFVAWQPMAKTPQWCKRRQLYRYRYGPDLMKKAMERVRAGEPEEVVFALGPDF